MVVVVSLLLALVIGTAFTSAGYAKMTDQPAMVRARQHLGVRATTYRAVGVAELIGAVGIAFGLLDVFAWVGLLAAFGLLALMVSAVGAHLRVEDHAQELVPAVVLGFLSVAYVATVAAG